jgi:glycosyltransferase involved in cell wall biosynthesis
MVQQPALPKYRVPFFRECASRPGISLVVRHGAVPGLPNEAPEGFQASFEPLRIIRIGRQELLWHGAQWRHLTRRETDVAVLSWNARYLSLLPSLLRARVLGMPVVLWGHGYSKEENPLRLAVRDCLARLAQAVLFYNYATAKTFLDRGWRAERVYVAPNSLDQAAIAQVRDRWLGDPPRLKEFQRQRGLDGGPVLINVGRIYPENRLETLVRALPVVAARWPTVKLVVIGKVAEEAQRLQQLARSLSVAGRIFWAGAIYDEEQIAPWMLTAALFCYPANIGLSIMHAMGYGLPVITGDSLTSHNPEIEVLQDGVNGVLFKHDDAVALAAVINDLLGDPGRLAAMSAAARRAIEAGYTIPKMADGFMAAVRYAASRRRQPPGLAL